MIVLPNGTVLYECDREKNTECKHKLHCGDALTDCHMTSNIEFASDKEDYRTSMESSNKAEQKE